MSNLLIASHLASAFVRGLRPVVVSAIGSSGVAAQHLQQQEGNNDSGRLMITKNGPSTLAPEALDTRMLEQLHIQLHVVLVVLSTQLRVPLKLVLLHK